MSPKSSSAEARALAVALPLGTVMVWSLQLEVIYTGAFADPHTHTTHTSTRTLQTIDGRKERGVSSGGKNGS